MVLYPPMTNDVKWNSNEKIIGVVGVAPAATSDFYVKLIQLTPVKKDWEHVRVIIDSNPKIPSRGRYLELGETDPVPFIRQSIGQLQSLGAGIIAVPCNTAHILYKRYSEGFAVTIPNMIEVTVDSVIRNCKKNTKLVAVFASKLSQDHRLYGNAFEKHGIATLDTSLYQADISSLIEGVKQGKSIKLLRNKMNTLLSIYKEADAFVLGCTELSLLAQVNLNNVPIIDSNTALAESCLKLASNEAFLNNGMKNHAWTTSNII